MYTLHAYIPVHVHLFRQMYMGLFMDVSTLTPYYQNKYVCINLYISVYLYAYKHIYVCMYI